MSKLFESAFDISLLRRTQLRQYEILEALAGPAVTIPNNDNFHCTYNADDNEYTLSYGTFGSLTPSNLTGSATDDCYVYLEAHFTPGVDFGYVNTMSFDGCSTASASSVPVDNPAGGVIYVELARIVDGIVLHPQNVRQSMGVSWDDDGTGTGTPAFHVYFGAL